MHPSVSPPILHLVSLSSAKSSLDRRKTCCVIVSGLGVSPVRLDKSVQVLGLQIAFIFGSIPRRSRVSSMSSLKLIP